ncbi:histidine phosphatase family protein [Sphaerotilus microaerophilus]|uniref:Phosphoglycerate mutase n=1 Tax=Sphaerotilus microaerophilus TaxID=2914710 RepID=A0ABM7YU38_9BURK|nr:histidine phosphatase family protein [Sphaerotilus sp. FB-5]BDI08203.1 phosphoglycerate mutase [Sphaerotilus sp. FB-5]
MPYSEMTRILAIRHGETTWNVDSRIQGQLDIGLNALGRRQAECAARHLADEGLDAIYSSDLQRAHDTALALAQPAGLAVQADAGLRERRFGVFEGRTFAEIDAEWPELALRWKRRDPDFGAPGGETLAEFYDRCVATATRLAAAHAGQTLALVTHGGVLDCLYRAATRIELNAPRTWTIGNTSINRLLWTPDGFTLVGWGDTQHLDGLDAVLDEASDGGRVG